ncbi:uncharacterized protein LOC121923121 [Sceloporus undulatus]|uniref:uncharacterized protein LOC121923121 n=1 Tax=Sceloporus undulatus TaxID=8520 RepID=UPI001C4D87CE|nr:uncharacterized protein LOC121923121 [Sceloporus undulatus]
MGAINIPFYRELQEIFAGDASVEPKRAAGGNGLEFRHLEDTEEPLGMPPQTQSSDDFSPSAGSEDLFSQEVQPGTFLLNLTSINDDADMTQIQLDDGETGEHNSNTNVQHKDSQDVNMCSDDENNECEFPNLQPVKPSATFAARQRQGLTPSERRAMIKRRQEKSTCEKMCEKLIECSQNNVKMMIENSNDRFAKEMNWKEMYFRKTGDNFIKLISVLEDFSSIYKEACANFQNKEVRILRWVKKKPRTKKNVQLTPEKNIDKKEFLVGNRDNEASTRRIQVPEPKVRSQRLIRKPVPFSP